MYKIILNFNFNYVNSSKLFYFVSENKCNILIATYSDLKTEHVNYFKKTVNESLCFILSYD